MIEKTKTMLRDIREDRKRDFSRGIPHFEKEKHNQILLLEPHFKIDIVNLMKMWSEDYRINENPKKTPISRLLELWSKSANDQANERNRKNAIQALINNGVLLVTFKEFELNIAEFFRDNSYQAVKLRNSTIQYRSPKTKKTYEQAFRSFVRFILKFLYGENRQVFKKGKILKRGIRAFELFEMASIFELLELQALKCRSEMVFRDLLIFRIMLYAGESIEIKDILKLERTNIDPENNTVHFKKKSVKCSDTFMKLLKSYLGPRRKLLFADSLNVDDEQDLINKRFSSICEKAGIFEDVFPRCIQRSYIYILKKEGVIR